MILLCTVFLWACVFLHKTVFTVTRRDTIPVHRVSSFSVLIYILLHRDNIAFVSTYFPPSKSILVRMNFLPTPNFTPCPLEWATLEIRFSSVYFVFWSIVFHLTWISESCTYVGENFSPIEHFAVIDRALRYIGKIIRNPLFFTSTCL